jgi:hypothetical protein
MNPATVILTNFQKGVLAVVATAPTPKLAFDQTVGSINLMSARNTLERLGFISIEFGEAKLTNVGNDALVNYNLVDDAGQVTEDGTKFVELVTAQIKGTTTVPTESFDLLKSLT